MSHLKHLVILVLVFSSITILQAQEYQTLFSNRNALYEDYDKKVKCACVDSTEFLIDSIFYLKKGFQFLGDFDCPTPNGISWLGEKVIIKNNGINVFFNKNNDTILINTRANLNESWTAFRLGDDSLIRATISEHLVTEVFGEPDSIKTIEFQAMDTLGNVLDHEINEVEFILSKSHGFTKLHNFYLFPYLPEDEFQKFESFSLIGSTNPDSGVQNLTFWDIYNYDIGDEIHILFKDFQYASYWELEKDIIRKEIYKYLDKQVYSDSIVYTIDKSWTYKRTVPLPVVNNYTHDTIVEVTKLMYERDSVLNLYPGSVELFYGQAFELLMYNEGTLRKVIPDESAAWFWLEDDSCWYDYHIDGACYGDFDFSDGLGGPYFHDTNTYCEWKRELVYYNKNGDTWGTPFELSSISPFLLDGNLKFSPNPTSGEVVLSMDRILLPAILKVYDIQGKLVLSKEVNEEVHTIDLSSLGNGVYPYKAILSGDVIKSGKLIVNK